MIRIIVEISEDRKTGECEIAGQAISNGITIVSSRTTLSRAGYGKPWYMNQAPYQFPYGSSDEQAVNLFREVETLSRRALPNGSPNEH